MASSNVNLVNRVFIGDGANSAAIADLSLIAKGDLFLMANGVPITTVAGASALSKTDEVYIVAGLDTGVPIISGKIRGTDAVKYEGKSKIDKAEKVLTVGYNGTAGTGIDATVGREYRLRVMPNDSLRPFDRRKTLYDANYTLGTAETAEDLASKIIQLITAEEYGDNFLKNTVEIERVSDGTRVAFAGNATVVYGSKLVTTAVAHTLAVGEIVKFEGKAYLVKEVPSATTLKLDIPYQGVSATILATDADTGVYADATEWGFLISGLTQEALNSRCSNEPLDSYKWVDFDVIFSDADDYATGQYVATVTETTAINAGQGYWRQVAEAEEKAKGYWGDSSKMNYYDKRIDSNVVKDTYYDSVKIQQEFTRRGSLQNTMTSPTLVEIYIPDGGAQGDETPGNNEFLAVLNGYFSTVLGFDAISF